MAEPEKKPDVTESAEPSSQSDQKEVASSAEAPVATEEKSSEPQGADGTQETEPEFESLTPELFVDETRRGDLVIVVVTVLLGFLLAMFKIGDIAFWGHLALGRTIVEQGIPRSDPFSYVVQEEASVDPNWLSEAALYTMYSSVGPAMLVFLKALGGVLLTLLLLGIRRPGPTLWGTACGVALVLALTGQDFVAGPAFMTLLGLAVYLALMHRIRHKGQPWLMWAFIPLQALWVNLDERAFVGLVLVALFLIGEFAARGLSAARADRLATKSLASLAGVLVLMVLASLANPYGVRALTYPLHLYGTMQPALVDYWEETGFAPPMLLSLWGRLEQMSQAGSLEAFMADVRWLEALNAALLLAVIVSFVMNSSRFDAARLMVFVGFSLLAAFSLGMLSLFSVVAVTVLVMNAQEWYVNRFGTEPRLETGWIVWSRTGRAATVLGLAVLAVLGSAGWLRGTNGYDFGLGIHPLMQESLDAIHLQISELPPEARGFNMTLDQATVLMWLAPEAHRRACYMNDRMALYASASTSAWRDYLLLRRELLNPGFWKPKFDEHGIDYVMLSMTPPAMLPEYAALMASADWTSASLGGSLALFVREDLTEGPMAEYRDKHRVDFVKAAYRDPHAMPPAPDYPVESPSWLYDPLWKTRNVVPEGIARAEHLWNLQIVLQQQRDRISLDEGVSLNLLAIRNLRETLASRYVDNPNGYLILAGAYEKLLRLELALTASRLADELTGEEMAELPAIRQPHNVRFYQLLTALNQAATADPKSIQARAKLADWYEIAQKWDLSLEQYEALLPLLKDEENITQASEKIVRLKDRVDRVRQLIDYQVTQGGQSDVFALARIARSNGCPKLAIEQFYSANYGTFSPDTAVVLAHLYMESGQPELAIEQLRDVREAPAGVSLDELWGMIHLLRGDYSSSRASWTQAIETGRRAAASDYLFTLQALFAKADPLRLFVQAKESALQPLKTASGLLHLGMMLLEAGQVEQAAEHLEEVLEVEPDAPFRVLAVFYLNRLRDENVDSYRPSDYAPVVFADTAEMP